MENTKLVWNEKEYEVKTQLSVADMLKFADSVKDIVFIGGEYCPELLEVAMRGALVDICVEGMDYGEETAASSLLYSDLYNILRAILAENGANEVVCEMISKTADKMKFIAKYEKSNRNADLLYDVLLGVKELIEKVGEFDFAGGTGDILEAVGKISELSDGKTLAGKIARNK